MKKYFTPSSIIARGSVAPANGRFIAFPLERIALPLQHSFSGMEFESISQGMLSNEMNEKWNVYYEMPWIYIHRSWTGVCMYAVRLVRQDQFFTVTEAYLNAYPGQNPSNKSFSFTAIGAHCIQIKIIFYMMLHRDDGNLPPHELLLSPGSTHKSEKSVTGIVSSNSAIRDTRIDGNDTRRLLGAIAGDIIGSSYEAIGEKRFDLPLFTEFSRFTDDTVMTCAIAESILLEEPCALTMRSWGKRYPMAGYGQGFERWIFDDTMGAYGSSGNGSAMRVTAIGLSCTSIDEGMIMASESAICTHNHPEGIQGAQAVALAVWLAKEKASKAKIKSEITTRIGYDLTSTLSEIRPGYCWSASCKDSVPQAIQCFLEAENYEHAIRNVLSLGGDTDTMGAIAGAIAAAYWDGIPGEIADSVQPMLTVDILDTINHFSAKYL